MSDGSRQGAGQHGQRALQGPGPSADNTESDHQQPSLAEALQALHQYPLSDRSMLPQSPFLVLPSSPLQGSSSLEGPGIHGGGGGGSGAGTVGMSPGGVMGLSSQHGQTLQGLRGQGAQLYGAQLGSSWQTPQSSLHQSDMISYYVPTFGSSGQGSGVPGGSGGGPGSGGGARSGGGGPGSPSGGSTSGLGIPSLGGLGFSPLPSLSAPVPVSGPTGPSPAEVTLRLFPEAGGRPGGGGIPQSPSPQSHLQQQQDTPVGISCRSPGMGMGPAHSRGSSGIPPHMGAGDRMGGESTPPASPGLQQLHVLSPMVRVGDPGAVAGGSSYNWSRVFDLPKYWTGEGNVGGEVIQGSVVEVPHGGGAMEGGGQMGPVGTGGPGMAPQGEVQTVQEVPKRRAKRGQATDPHSIAERIRRERISERLRKLHELLPISDKVDTATMLDEAIQYVRRLQGQVQDLTAKRAEAGGSSTAGGAPEGEAQGGGGVTGTSVGGGEGGRGAGGTSEETPKGPTTSETLFQEDVRVLPRHRGKLASPSFKRPAV